MLEISSVSTISLVRSFIHSNEQVDISNGTSWDCWFEAAVHRTDSVDLHTEEEEERYRTMVAELRRKTAREHTLMGTNNYSVALNIAMSVWVVDPTTGQHYKDPLRTDFPYWRVRAPWLDRNHRVVVAVEDQPVAEQFLSYCYRR